MISQDKMVKISDFGLAGVINKLCLDIGKQKGDVKAAYGTVIGTAFGTPQYMPPEQFENAAGCDERSDIYSFGIVLYQMASGNKLPFYPEMKGDNWYVLHCRAAIPKLRTPLFPIIFRCLEKRPISRYYSGSSRESVGHFISP